MWVYGISVDITHELELQRVYPTPQSPPLWVVFIERGKRHPL